MGAEEGSFLPDSVGALRVLLLRAGERACALPLANVVEIMRPLPIERIDGAPPFVLGTSIVRGVLSPVVDLARLIGASSVVSAKRFVSVSLEGEITSLAVNEVRGVSTFERETFGALPSVLRDLTTDVVEAARSLDARLLILLRVTKTIRASALLSPGDSH